MKRKDIKALHGKDRAELEKELTVKRKELTKLTLEQKVKRVKNTRMQTSLKDDIARIATIITEIQEKEKKA